MTGWIVVYAAIWFVAAVSFARTWRDPDGCPQTCRHVTVGGNFRVYHSPECSQPKPDLCISPVAACFAAAVWPLTLPYRAVVWAAAWQPKRGLSEAELARLDRELNKPINPERTTE
jgi:hypothetical protein